MLLIFMLLYKFIINATTIRNNFSIMKRLDYIKSYHFKEYPYNFNLPNESGLKKCIIAIGVKKFILDVIECLREF